MKVINSLFLSVLFAGFCFAQKQEKVIAKINNEPIMQSDFDKNKEALIEQYSMMSPDFLSQKGAQEKISSMVMDKLVNETLLRQKAETMKIKVFERQIDEGVAEIKKRFPGDNPLDADRFLLEEIKKQGMTMTQFREKVKRDLMARKLIEEAVKPKIKPPQEKEIKKYFDLVTDAIAGAKKPEGMDEETYEEYVNVAAKFKELISERLRVRHILFKPASDSLTDKTKAIADAEKARKDLLAGADFEELAEKLSKDKQSAVRGGDIGYVIKGMLPEELDKAVFKMCPGDISQPIESKFGYHIVRVDEKRIAQKLKYEIAKEDIAQIIMQNSFADEIEKYTENLKKEAKIEFFNDK